MNRRSPQSTPTGATRHRQARRVLAACLATGLVTAAALAAHASSAPSSADRFGDVSAASAARPLALAAAPSPRTALVPRTARASRGTARTALPPVPTTVVTQVVAVGSTFSGEASWYGGSFQGRRTASGERFDTNDLTAASKTLPFGTRLRVCHQQRCVVVRINDRGPYVGQRILDLSRAAKDVLGYDGVGHVTATPVATRSVTVVDQAALARQRVATRAAQVRAAQARRTAAVRRAAVLKRAAVASQAAARRASEAAARPTTDPERLTALSPVPTAAAAGLLLLGSGGLVRLRRRRAGS